MLETNQKIPILLYHALFDKEANTEKYAISKAEFEKQIKYLSEKGFKSLSPADFFETGKSVKSKKDAIVVTFDDGNYSDYSIAFPILKKYGFGAVFFVTTNWVGTKNYMTWSNLKEMAENGMSIQSHSMTHSFLSDLSPDNLYKELNESRNIIGENLNIIADYISLPGGFCSRKVLNTAKDAGYKAVYTSSPGLNGLDCKEKDFTILNRFVITKKTSFEDFKAIVNRDKKKIALYILEHYFKSSIKKILGSKRYYTIWSRFFKYDAN